MAAAFQRRILMGAAAGLALAFVWHARSMPAPRTLSIAAMPPGTSWYVFASTLAGLLEKELPLDVDVEVIARGGGVGNPMLVERGKAALGLSQVATAVWAREGHRQAYGGAAHPNIRALAGGLNAVWITAILREDYIRRTGNDTLEKALASDRPPRIIMKPPGSSVPLMADMILELLGTSRESIAARGGAVIQVSANQIPDMLRDGRADLYFESAIQGHPALTEVATTVDIRILDFSPGLLKGLAALGLTPKPMPAWFRGQQKPALAADCGTVLIAHKDMPDDLAYLVTKILCERRDVMIRAHKAWSDFDPRQGGRIEATGIPLHPGAERFYREKGWL